VKYVTDANDAIQRWYHERPGVRSRDEEHAAGVAGHPRADRGRQPLLHVREGRVHEHVVRVPPDREAVLPRHDVPICNLGRRKVVGGFGVAR